MKNLRHQGRAAPDFFPPRSRTHPRQRAATLVSPGAQIMNRFVSSEPPDLSGSCYVSRSVLPAYGNASSQVVDLNSIASVMFGDVKGGVCGLQHSLKFFERAP